MPTLKIEVQIQKPLRPRQLATFSATLTCDCGHCPPIKINDGRVVKSKQGNVWAALPMYSISNGGRDWAYHPTVELSSEVQRALNNAVLAVFEKWEAQP